ncbi:transport and Golgi organization protein 1 homolog [Erethizon dorsatum]
MLMARGEALGDFTGPDCRFVSFRKGDPVYVYYKLAGVLPEVWAGSVGRIFGYFPKDLIRVDYEYTKEELRVPADETDFVCFDGGRDEFDSYDVEELLGFLELYDSATEDSVQEAPPRGEKPPEVPAGSGPAPGPVGGNAEGGSRSESTPGLGGPMPPAEHQPSTDPGPASVAWAEPPPSEAFEEMLQEKLKVPEGENNRTGSCSQAPGEQKKVDAYKLLKKEMTPDLKTKFGSTADAMVSDDETTGLVTSLEDDFDEAPDAEACTTEGAEVNESDFDELPLLTFTGAEEPGPPEGPRLEKSSAEAAQSSEEEGRVSAALPPGIRTGDRNILTAQGDTFFPIVTGGDGRTGMPGSEGSNSEEEKEDDNVAGPESDQRKPQTPTDDFDPETAGDFFVEVFKTNDENDPEVDTEPHNKEKGRDIEEPKAALVQDVSQSEGVQHEGVVAHGSPPRNGQGTPPAAGKGKDTLQPALESRDSDPQEAGVHVEKDALQGGGRGAKTSADGSESGAAQKAAGSRVTEGVREQEPSGAGPPTGAHPHNASGRGVQGAGGSAGGPSLPPGPAQHRRGEHSEEPGLKAQNQPQFLSPAGVALSGKSEEEVPSLGGNLSWLRQRDAAAALGQRAIQETESTADSAQPWVEQGTEESERPDGVAAPGSHAEETEGDEEEEEDEELPEELLEDENAVSAKQSEEMHPEVRDGKSHVSPQGSEEAHLGTIHPHPGTKENQQEPNVTFVIEKENATAAREGGKLGRGLGSMEVGGEDGSPPAQDGDKAWAASEPSGPAGQDKAPSPGPGKVLQENSLGGVQQDGDSSRPAERPAGELSKEAKKARDAGSPGPASADPGDDLSQRSPHAGLEPGLGGGGEDWPIIRSFFKELQSLQRFLKYLNVHELEAMLQDMSSKLKAVQQESLPYNTDKVLDKVFRASESQILSAAEKMLDAHVTRNRDLGLKENNVLEEYAVLDDVQDLIYFVRYKHLVEEEPTLLTTAPALEEGWSGPTQELQPPPGNHFPQETIEDPQLPEELDTGTPEVAQSPSPQEDEAPEVILTEGSPAEPGGAEQRPAEVSGEEQAHTSPVESMVLTLHSFLPYISKMVLPRAQPYLQETPSDPRAISWSLPSPWTLCGPAARAGRDRRSRWSASKEAPIPVWRVFLRCPALHAAVCRSRAVRPVPAAPALRGDPPLPEVRTLNIYEQPRPARAKVPARPAATRAAASPWRPSVTCVYGSAHGAERKAPPSSPAPCRLGEGRLARAGSGWVRRELPFAMDAVPAAVPAVAVSPGEPELLGPLSVLYAALVARLLELVATLPEDVQPGPDFYGLPWKPVLLTACLGIVSFAIFFWRTVLAVKERIYQVTEQQISEKVKNTTKENAELVQKLSNYEQKIKESKKLVQETKKQNMILSDEAIKYKDKIKVLEENNEILGDTAKTLRVMLESEREQNVKNQDLILENKKSVEKLKDVISVNASEFSEVQVALNEAKLSEEKVKSECHQVQEENVRLKKKKVQLEQEIEDWKKSHAELREQIKSFEKSQRDLEAALAHKDDSIGALTSCITQLNQLECGSESEGPRPGGNEPDELANGEVGGDQSEMKNQIRQMMDVSRTQTAISVLQEDLKLLQVKLRALMSAKCDLEDQIKKLDENCGALQSAKARLEEECRTLLQKVEILNELYQQKEMALQKKLSQEEYELQERDQRLSAADEKVVLAAEEVRVYKRRIQEMEEELQKTERSFKNQLAAHEKKAHENWLKARNAERLFAKEKREAATLRHRLVEVTQKMAMRQDEPVIVKRMPGRPGAQNPPRRGPLSQNGSFGPSPVSGGECSPPLSVEPPGRPLSATFAQRDLPRSEFDPGPGPRPMANSGSRGSSPAKGMDEGKQIVPQEPEGPSIACAMSVAERPAAVSVAMRGPPAFPGPPFVGGPLPPPVGYGPPPPQLFGPFGPRPMPPPPPPFVPPVCPPLGLREYAPGMPPGRRDLPLHPREFLPGHAPFRPPGPLGPREYFIPGPRLPPPAGPQDCPPPPAEGNSLLSGPREEPAPASPRSSQDSSQALRQSP